MVVTLREKAKELEEYTIETRRFLHENPEISGKEEKTALFLKEEVKKLGLPIEQASTTGFIATLDTGKVGKTVALRTDIDALPILENPQNLTKDKICLSKNEGAAHMCGHDGHMAILLTVMRILVRMKDELTGKIIFIFEEGEEIGCGIAEMLETLKDKKIEAIYGTHLTSFMDTGQICIDAGPRMAGAIVIDMDIIGKSGHGSRPDLSINPVFAAAQVLNGIGNAWNNQIDVSKTVTLGLTQIHGGEANNIIPDKVFIGGSLRYFDLEEGKKALEVLKNVSTKTAEAQRCTVEFRETTRIATLPLVNDEELAKIAQTAVNTALPGNLVKNIDWYASESFAHYAKIAPSVFSFVGIRNAQVGSGAEHHNSKFDLDEAALSLAVTATAQFAVDFLMK